MFIWKQAQINTPAHRGNSLTSDLADGKQSERLPTIYSIQTDRQTDMDTRADRQTKYKDREEEQLV